MIRLIVPKDWRYRHPKRGVQVLSAGEYSVPDQVSLEISNRAILEGVATSYRVRLPESVVVPVEAPVKRGRGRPRKGPAPENRALGAAPENKAAIY